MQPVVVTRISTCSAAELFHVAADIEAYPQFLPNFIAARVKQQTPCKWLVDNVLRWWGITMNVQTQATLDPPHGIDIRAVNAVGMDFTINWHFEDVEGGARVRFTLSLELPSTHLEALAQNAVARQAQIIADAFIRRTAEITMRS